MRNVPCAPDADPLAISMYLPKANYVLLRSLEDLFNITSLQPSNVRVLTRALQGQDSISRPGG